MAPTAHDEMLPVEPIVERLAKRFATTRGALLPLLHALQEEIGHVPDAAVAPIADRLNLSRAEVHGVVSFYHDFKSAPEPLPVIKLCRAEACQARGSEALAPRLEALAAGKAKVETVYCLGLCSVGPNAMANGEVYAHLDDVAAKDLIAEVCS